MKITILVEGRTEIAFKPHLQAFLSERLLGRMPRLDVFKYDGRIPKEDKLRRTVENLLKHGNPPADAVIALTGRPIAAFLPWHPQHPRILLFPYRHQWFTGIRRSRPSAFLPYSRDLPKWNLSGRLLKA
jgi:hypothetical protein